MLPIVALVGKNNVGKSTLFNRLTCTRNALVGDHLELTRDRKYGYVNFKKLKFIIIDTAGMDCLFKKNFLDNYIVQQSVLAVKEADIILFVLDGRFLLTELDYEIMNFLRKFHKIILIVVNKLDSVNLHNGICDYFNFGVKDIIPISAIHKHGINELLHKIERKIFGVIKNDKKLKKFSSFEEAIFSENFKKSSLSKTVAITLAIVGSPNTGKSTLINYLVGNNRVISCDIPGTTRDVIHVPIFYNKKKYILIDTAGIYKNKKNYNREEKIFIKKTLKVITDANVVLVLFDASVDFFYYNYFLLKFSLKYGRSVIVVINKWDKISLLLRQKIQKKINLQINKFSVFIKIHFVSSLYGIGINSLFKSINKIYQNSINAVSVSKLIKIMNSAVSKFPPPLFNRKKIKLKYIHIGGYNPLIFIIHGFHVSKLPISYQCYLQKYFYNFLNIQGTMLRLYFKDTDLDSFK